MKSKKFLFAMQRLSLVFIFMGASILRLQAELIVDESVHLQFEIDTDKKEAYVANPGGEGFSALAPPRDKQGYLDVTNYWEYLVIPDHIAYKGESYEVVGIGSWAFNKETRIKTVKLPSTIRFIEPYAFYMCVGLESINIPEGITYMGDYLFFACRKITSIHLPEEIDSIGGGAFADCTRLEEINIPGKCRKINIDAFLGCKNLAKLTIEDSEEPLQFTYTVGISIYYEPHYDEDGERHARGQFADCKISDLYVGRNLLLPKPQYSSVDQKKWQSCFPFERCSEYRSDFKYVHSGPILNNLEFGDEVTEIPDSIFSGYSGMGMNAGVYGPLYNGSINNKIVLPRKLKKIGNYAFPPLINTELVLPETLDSIGTYAFGSIPYVTRISIPSSLKKISDNAFYGCGDLEELIIPEALSEIGINAFGRNRFPRFVRSYASTPPSLANNIFENSAIYVPAGTGNVYRKQWKGLIIDSADEIVTVNVKKSGTLYSRLLAQDIQISDVCRLKLKGTLNDDDWAIVGTMSNLYEWDLSELNTEELPNELLEANTSLINISLPTTLTSIRESLFVKCNHLIGSIDIPANCQVGDSAFVGTRIDKISISGSAKIGNYAFSSCPQIQEVHAEGNEVSIGHKAFSQSFIKKVILGNGVEVADSAFFNENAGAGDSFVDTIYIENGVKSIGKNNFGHVKKQVFLGDVGHIGYNAFSGADSIYASDITTWCTLPFSDASNVTSHLYIGNEEVHDIVIPTEVKEIRKYLFYNCASLTSINLHDGITQVGDSAFMNCPQLVVVNLPSSLNEIKNGLLSGCSNLKQIVLPSSLVSIGDGAFNETGLTSIQLPTTMKSIGNRAFYGTNITAVQMPKSLTRIGNYAFASCSQLEEIGLSPQTTHIGQDAFENCVAMKEILLPNSLSTIESGVFQGCSNLQEIKIPTSVSSIENGAFHGCRNLKSVIVQWENPPTPGEDAFSDISPECYLYTPIGSSTTYFKAGWDMFKYLKEAGLINIVVNNGGTVIYNNEEVANRTKEFVYAPYKSFNVNIIPNDGYYLKKVKLNNNRVEDEVEENTYLIEEPEENLTLDVVFANENIEMGDANGDGQVNMTDVEQVMNKILKRTDGTFYDYYSDMNDDDVINVTDALRIISKLKNK